MNQDWESPFYFEKGCYRSKFTGRVVPGITKDLRAVFFPEYTQEKATKSTKLLNLAAVPKGSGADPARRYGKQSAARAGMLRGKGVGDQLAKVHAACKKHKITLRDFVDKALIARALKSKLTAAGVLADKSSKSRSKAAVQRRKQVPQQMPLRTDGTVARPYPAEVVNLMKRLRPFTMHLLQYLRDQKLQIAAVELLVGDVKSLNRCTGIDVLLWDADRKGYLLTEVKCGFGQAHAMHTGNLLKAPFDAPDARDDNGQPLYDSPENQHQLQMMLTEVLTRQTFNCSDQDSKDDPRPRMKILQSQQLLVSSTSRPVERFPLRTWATSRVKEFVQQFSKRKH
jgi:hypothetical protein